MDEFVKPKLSFFSINKYFYIVDIYILLMFLLFIAKAIFFINVEAKAISILFIDTSLVILYWLLLFFEETHPKKKIFSIFHILFLVPTIFLMYNQVQIFLPHINPNLYDKLLFDIDVFLVGGNVFDILYKLANPYLTEFVQISYMMFFFMPLIFAIELFRKETSTNFHEFVRVIILSFFISYLLYYFLPAVGPRFTEFDFSNINTDLPGVFFTDMIRNIINIGGGIPNGSIDPASVVNRDCMPSGHTWITLINIYYLFKFRSRFRWIFLVFSTFLIFGTVYLRYHYLIDVIIAVFFAVLTIIFDPIIRDFFKYTLRFKKVKN